MVQAAILSRRGLVRSDESDRHTPSLALKLVWKIAAQVEVLADVLVLAHADLLVAGASAVAEAAHWLAWPRLHNASVHVAYREPSRALDPTAFAAAATAVAPRRDRAAALDAAWTLPPPNERGRVPRPGRAGEAG